MPDHWSDHRVSRCTAQSKRSRQTSTVFTDTQSEKDWLGWGVERWGGRVLLIEMNSSSGKVVYMDMLPASASNFSAFSSNPRGEKGSN